MQIICRLFYIYFDRVRNGALCPESSRLVNPTNDGALTLHTYRSNRV